MPFDVRHWHVFCTTGLRLERCAQGRIRIEKVFLFIAQASKDSHVFFTIQKYTESN